MKKVLIVLSNNFADDEAFIPQKIFEQCKDIESVFCGLESDTVVSSSGYKMTKLPLYSDLDLALFSALLIPGGLKCVKGLKDNWAFLESLITRPEHLYLCCIGSVPAVILAPLGLIEGEEVTCLPLLYSFGNGFQFSQKDVCVSHKIISAKDKSFALEYSQMIIKALG